nr:hypothetical protein [Nocardioides glacieisoli]
MIAQHRHRPVTRRVVLEQPLHPVGSPFIELDGLDLPAVFDAFTGVDVAERCGVDGATALRLLQHAFAGLGREVATIKLGDRAHDAVQQHSAGCLVDVLGAADQLGTRSRQRDVDLDVIDAIARQTIDLVHDDSADVMIRDVAEHALEFRAVSRSGAFTGVDELLDYLNTERLGLAQTRFALSRNRKAFTLTAASRLILRADS